MDHIPPATPWTSAPAAGCPPPTPTPKPSDPLLPRTKRPGRPSPHTVAHRPLLPFLDSSVSCGHRIPSPVPSRGRPLSANTAPSHLPRPAPAPHLLLALRLPCRHNCPGSVSNDLQVAKHRGHLLPFLNLSAAFTEADGSLLLLRACPKVPEGSHLVCLLHPTAQRARPQRLAQSPASAPSLHPLTHFHGPMSPECQTWPHGRPQPRLLSPLAYPTD